MFADLPPVPAAIAAGVLFFLIVGRMFWDSFKSLFGDFFDLIFPAFIVAMLTDWFDAGDSTWQMFLLVLGSIVTAVLVYFKLAV